MLFFVMNVAILVLAGLAAGSDVRGDDTEPSASTAPCADEKEVSSSERPSLNPLVAVLQRPGPNARLDASGDVMPPGMIQRLGSTRFKVHGWWRRLTFAGDDEWIWLKADGRVSVIHRETGSVVGHDRLRLGDWNVSSLTASPDGGRVAIGMSQFQQDADGLAEYRVVILSARSTSHLQELKWKALAGELHGLAFSGDGRTLLTGTERGDVQLWNSGTGELLQQHAFGEVRIRDAALAPDGSAAALVGWQGAHVWKIQDEQPILLAKQHTAAVCFAANDNVFATIARDGARLWTTGLAVALLKTPEFDDYDDADFGIAFTPDGRRLAVPVHTRDIIEVWDVKSQQRVAALPVASPRGLAISRNGRWLAASSDASTTTIFDLETFQPAGRPPEGHNLDVLAVRFVTGEALASASEGDARLWDISTGRQQHTLPHERPKTTIRGLTVSPDGSTIVTSGFDDTLGVWDRHSGKRRFSLKGHGRVGGCRVVQFKPDGSKFASFGDDGVVRWWGPNDGRLVAEHPLDVPGYVDPAKNRGEGMWFPIAAAFTPDANSLFVIFGGKLSEFDTRTGRRLRERPIVENAGPAIVSPNGRWLGTSESVRSPDGKFPAKVLLRDRATLEVAREWPVRNPRKGPPSDDEDDDENDSTRPRRAQTWFVAQNGIAFSPDSTRLAWSRVGASHAIDIVDVEVERVTTTIPVDSPCVSLDFSPDCRRLATGHADTTISVWDLSHPAFTVEAAGAP
jgi:WD40 repeat protein